MGINTPLINLAILESLQKKSASDEIDLIVPYVVLVLNDIEEESFDVETLRNTLKEQFGFNPPPSAFDVILKRVSNKGYIRKNNGQYFKNSDNIAPLIEANRGVKKEVNISINQLVNEYIKFAKNRHEIEINKDEAEALLFDFINKNISIFTDSLESGTFDLIDKKVKNKDHLTSTFITHLYEEKIQALDSLDTIIKGALLSNYLTLADSKASKTILKNITVYLDTALIIGLLGYNGGLKSKSLKEFLELLTKVGINVFVYEDTLEELRTIMEAWVSDLENHNYSNFNPKTLELLKSKGYDTIRLKTEITLLKSTVLKLGLQIKDFKTHDPKFQCNETSLEDHLDYHGKAKTVRHDVLCVSEIYKTRKNKSINVLDETFTVFITTNNKLEKKVKSFFKEDKVDGKIPLVSNAKWISTICWFKNPNAFPSMPIKMMVSNAYNVIYADDKFWNQFLTKLEKLKQRAEITEDEFNLVRWDSNLMEMAHNASIKSGQDYTDQDMFEIIDEVRNDLLKDHKKKIKDVENERDGVKNELLNVNSALDNLANKIAGISSLIIHIALIVGTIYGLYLGAQQNPKVGLYGSLCLTLVFVLTFMNLWIGSEIRSTSQKVREFIYVSSKATLNKYFKENKGS